MFKVYFKLHLDGHVYMNPIAYAYAKGSDAKKLHLLK